MSPPRIRHAIALAALLTLSGITGCQAAARPDAFGRLNLPSSVEPAEDAPKQYRPTRKIDPEYMKHPSRWRVRLKARYA